MFHYVIKNIPTEAPVEDNSSSTNKCPSNPPRINLKNNIQEFFQVLKDMKEMLNITKLLKCIKNSANKTKNCVCVIREL